MSDATKPGFLQYQSKHLPKINAQRLANSLVNITSTPILERGQVLFSDAESANNEPRSCENCHFYNERAYSCQLMGPNVPVKKFTYPAKVQQGSEPIEYWPVCGMWDYGDPNKGVASFKKAPYDDPDDLGYGWVNAPKVGLHRSGTNCGGGNGGDDCDNYITKGPDKRAEATAFCRVLQDTVGNLDCCAAWIDDDWIEWQKGIKLLEELESGNRTRDITPNPLIK